MTNRETEDFTIRRTFGGVSSGERRVKLAIQTSANGRRFVVFDDTELTIEEKHLIVVAENYERGRVTKRVYSE